MSTDTPHTPASAADPRMRANERLATPATPLIDDCWYVAGWRADFGPTLTERTLLGRSLVLYRDPQGRAVALHNRCPHRSFPLVHGTLEGGQLRCRYHGLVFRGDGSCAEIPMQDTVPKAVCVRSYPVVERGPLAWIWMGDPARADPAAIPDTAWLDDGDWAYASGYLHLQASYVYLHENLLDLSHFTFLHPSTLGTPEYAKTPFELDVQDPVVRISRFVPDCAVPPMYRATGIQGRMSRRTDSAFTTPAVHFASVELRDLAAPPGQRDTFHGRITHFLTPESPTSTHYWFTFARDFAQADASVTQAFAAHAMTAFLEDKHALEEAARMHALEPEAPLLELHVKSDAAGVAARRVLKRLAGG